MDINKILITGATGFVGINLISFLDKDRFELTLSTRKDLDSDHFIIPDQINHIVHLAGKAHDLKQVSQPEEYYQVNFELTKKLYDAFLRSEASTFIFISSVKAVADSVNGLLTENVVPTPETHYGKSKLMAEDYIKTQPLPVGKSFYILRPCMIHGPGNRGNLNLLYQVVKKGIPYPLAAFQNKRSFLSVKNLCFVINELVTRKDIPFGVYNVADDQALSTKEVVEVLAKSLGKKPHFWQIPKSLIHSLAKVGNVLKLPLNTERLGKLTENYVVDNHKIISALGVKLPLSAREGLEQTANSFKTNN